MSGVAKLTGVHLIGRAALSALVYLVVVLGVPIVFLSVLLSLMGEPNPMFVPSREDFVQLPFVQSAPLFFGLGALAGYVAGFALSNLWIGIIGGSIGAFLIVLFSAAQGNAPPLWWTGVFLLTSGLSGGAGGAYRAARDAAREGLRLVILSTPSTWLDQIASLLAERYEVRPEWLTGIPEAKRLDALRVFSQRHQKEVVFKGGVIRPRVPSIDSPPFPM